MSPPVDGGRWDAGRAHPEVRVLENGTVFQSSGNGFRTCLCKRVMRDNGGYIARIQVRGISNFLVGVAMPDVEVGRSGEDRVEFCGRQGWGFYNGARGGVGDEGCAFYHADQPIRDSGGEIVRADYAQQGDTLVVKLEYEDSESGVEDTGSAGTLPGTLSFFRQSGAMPLSPIVFRRCIPRGVCFAVTAYHPSVRLHLLGCV